MREGLVTCLVRDERECAPYDRRAGYMPCEGGGEEGVLHMRGKKRM